jgi:hypothetical protein
MPVHDPPDGWAKHRRHQKPNEKVPATSLRSYPNSTINGGNSSEKAVRAVTAIAIVTKATATINHP